MEDGLWSVTYAASQRARSVRTVSDTFAASTQGLAANAQNVRKDWLDESNGKNKRGKK
jgi:hypothetical protein